MTRYLARVLAVDSDPRLQIFLRANLHAYGFFVADAFDGREAILRASADTPHIVLLDLDLPDLQGMEVIKRLREWSDVPIIVLTARTDEADKIAAFEHGANDYVTKPFGIGELTARIRAALRHRMQTLGTRPVFRIGDIAVDLLQQRVTRNGEDVKLSRREYVLLRALVRSAGHVVTHKQLVTEVWGRNNHLDRDYLRIYIARLRKKLEINPLEPRYILTEPAVGYRLQDEQPRRNPTLDAPSPIMAAAAPG